MHDMTTKDLDRCELKLTHAVCSAPDAVQSEKTNASGLFDVVDTACLLLRHLLTLRCHRCDGDLVVPSRQPGARRKSASSYLPAGIVLVAQQTSQPLDVSLKKQMIAFVSIVLGSAVALGR